MNRCALAALLLAACGGAAEPAPKRVVLVVVDTLRQDHLGVAGDRRELTPRLDALAAAGTWFPRALAASPWTRPSVASIFTGLHPGAHGVEGGDDALPPGLPTLAQLLADAGATTLAVSANANGGPAFGFDRGFAEFRVPLERRGWPDDFAKIPGDAVVGKAAELLGRVGEDESFLLFVHLLDPHDPYLEHPGLLGGEPPPGRFTGARKDLRRMDAAAPGELTEADRERIRWLYAGEVRFADECVGALLDALEARGWLDETLVIVTSDHGEELWNHGARAHGHSLYQELVHVPLIVRWPRAAGAGGRACAALAHHVDLLPTILAWWGIPAPPGIAGADLLPLVLDPSRHPGPSAAISQLDHQGIALECATDFLRKLIRDPARTAEQAFDLAADPGELRPLGAAPGFDGLRAALDSALELIALVRVEGVARPREGLDADVRAELAGLGYAGD